MSDTPRIYVASLSDYNAGRLHGEWIDADQEADAIWEDINAMLAASPENDVCQWCGGNRDAHNDDGRCPGGRTTSFLPSNAEEWAIHDYDNFHGLKLGEYENIERIATIGQALAEATDAGALAAWLDQNDDNTPDDFDDHFRGHWDSFKDFVTESELGDMVLGLSQLKSLAREGARFESPRTLSAIDDLIDHLSNYIDWDALARDTESGYTVVECGAPTYGVWIFEDEV